MKNLTRTEVADAVKMLLDPAAPDADKAAFLTALAQKGETAEEIAAFALELRDRAVNPGIDPANFGGRIMDVVGTGADMRHTFNISTCVIFVLAAGNVAVAKHGNRAITSQCGSADVLAALGVKIELSPDAARRCLEETGITFLFAPFYHPSFKAIAPVRKQLAAKKQRTIFNILGPLVNPARPTHQLLGVYDRALVAKFAEVLRLLGLKHALVAHGDGLDELSTMGPNDVAEVWAGRVEQNVRDFRTPSTMPRLGPVKPAELTGGDAKINAQIVVDILSSKDRGARRDIVLLNAAAAFVAADKADSFEHGWELAAALIDSGAAGEKLHAFVAASQSA